MTRRVLDVAMLPDGPARVVAVGEDAFTETWGAGGWTRAGGVFGSEVAMRGEGAPEDWAKFGTTREAAWVA